MTTAYSEFALEGYELSIVDYLLKPFSFERFLKAVNKVIGLNAPAKNMSSEDNNTSTNQVFLRQNKSYIQIDIATILFTEASVNYTKVVTTNDTISTREKISDMLDVLPSEEFLQVHKSFAVTKTQIACIEGNRIHIDDYTIPIGKMYKVNVNELLK
ncbi:MAG: LytTR family DNA-binding domain-containing protein [Psychroserpens sp.]|uniref:LytR/AlgR family response regulator transcription factor n=1 Tax=Psychroserpens sp. TaxID=2020870 RepID=UPI003002C01D